MAAKEQERKEFFAWLWKNWVDDEEDSTTHLCQHCKGNMTEDEFLAWLKKTYFYDIVALKRIYLEERNEE